MSRVYDPEKRRERYLQHRDREINRGKNRYLNNSEEIKAKLRQKYAENIDEERAKSREKARLRRKRYKEVSQKDTLNKEESA